tara:strand:+ start:94 stop:1083 length:990 start_codon:yes stop_codon:yes gene_type:complete
MNKEMYTELKENIPGFDRKHTKMISLNQLELDVVNSQVRRNGHQRAKVPAMVAAIDKDGQKTPISITRRQPNGKFQLKDGITRYLAQIERGATQVLASTYHDTLGWNAAQWFDFQCAANDHEPSTPNTDEDIRQQIQTRVDKGYLNQSLKLRYSDDPEKYLKAATKHLQNVYKNSGLKPGKIKTLLKRALSGALSVMYESYDKGSAMRHIANYNKDGWSTTKPHKDSAGDINNGVCFYGAGNFLSLRKDVLANGLIKKIDNPTVDICIGVWLSDLVGKTDQDVLKYRKKVADFYDKVNSKYKIFSGLYFLPQIKTGSNQENLYQLQKIR